MSSLVKEARAHVVAADEKQQRKAAAWRAARTDLKVMQRLEEQHEDGQRRAERAAEQATADDRAPRSPDPL